VGERLKGDLARIGEVAVQITWIGAEFDHAAKLADGCAPALGSPRLAAMLSAFASNWSIHRGRLLDDLRELTALAQAFGAPEDAV
jgi:hypothetical protein